VELRAVKVIVALAEVFHSYESELVVTLMVSFTVRPLIEYDSSASDNACGIEAAILEKSIKMTRINAVNWVLSFILLTGYIISGYFTSI